MYYSEVYQLLATCFLGSPRRTSTSWGNTCGSTSPMNNVVVKHSSALYHETRIGFQPRLPFLHVVAKQTLNSDEESESEGTYISTTAVDEIENEKTRKLLSTKRQKRIEVARLFLESIEQTPDIIADSDGMYVLSEVMFLESEERYPLIIRKNTEPFWDAVIDLVNITKPSGRNKNRVCAVGTPGIGKTRTTPILIRMLLERGKTVIYFLREPAGEGYYYEFIPWAGENNSTAVNAYNELQRDSIESLESTETYYIVDPGRTKDSCDKGTNFKPKVILVTSPDERHWGSTEFEKKRDGIRGFFKFMPVWSLDELFCAAPFLSFEDPELEDLLNVPEKLKEEIMNRYRLFGGVPRNIFDASDSREDNRQSQMSAINSLTVDQAERLFQRESQLVDNFRENQPKSAVMHYNSSVDSLFRERQTIIASDYVYEQVSNRFLSSLWNNVPNDRTGNMLETYVKIILSRPGKPVDFENQPIVESSDPRYNESLALYLGGCNEIRISSDPITSSLKYPMVMFYSYVLNFPLFDFCYFNDTMKQLVLFQATMAAKHDIKQNALKNLVEKVEKTSSCSSVLLCYAVHSSRYSVFSTTPKNPSVNSTFIFDVKKINVVGP
jgi:hypothetical protein